MWRFSVSTLLKFCPLKEVLKLQTEERIDKFPMPGFLATIRHHNSEIETQILCSCLNLLETCRSNMNFMQVHISSSGCSQKQQLPCIESNPICLVKEHKEKWADYRKRSADGYIPKNSSYPWKKGRNINQKGVDRLPFPSIFQVQAVSFREDTPPKTNIDTKNDGLENVSPFKHGYFGYLC